MRKEEQPINVNGEPKKDMASFDLGSLRVEIDTVDGQIIDLLSQRMRLVRSIGEYKKKHNITPLDSNRWQKVLESKLLLAQKLGLDQDLVRDIYERIHQSSLDIETRIREE